MKFIVSWTLSPGAYKEAAKRFLETRGAMPDGVELLGRWHSMGGHGFGIIESTNPKAMFLLRAQWADVMVMTISPCLDDAEVASVLASMQRH